MTRIKYIEIVMDCGCVTKIKEGEECAIYDLCSVHGIGYDNSEIKRVRKNLIRHGIE